MPSTDLRVRAAERADVPFIVECIRALADYEKLTHECTPDSARLIEHLFGERPYVEALIAEREGRKVGYALVFYSYSTFLTAPGLFLEDLFVLPEERGRGAGKALLDGVVEMARERGCERVEWSVLDWNEPAIRFYEAYGARPQDAWTVYRLARKPG
jgi:GNAT superfamily N-acetyltransferase